MRSRAVERMAEASRPGKEVSIVWLLAFGLTVGGLVILARTSHGWHVRHADLGWMSQQWLAQYRANGR